MYDRLVIMEIARICSERHWRCDVLILNDRLEDLDGRYLEKVTSVHAFSRSKFRYVVEFLRRILISKPRLIAFGHVNLGPLGVIARLLRPRAQQWFFVYGIDFWRRLPLMARVATRRADKIVTISNYTGRTGATLNDIDPARIALLPCALDPFWEATHKVKAEASCMPRSPVLLTVARLAASERYKGIEEVIRSMPRLLASYPELTYVIVGDGDDRERLHRLAADIGVASAVRFLGRVGQDELADAYSTSTALIMPSQKEGFGIVYLEAALFGKPSIAGRHGGSPEVVEDGRTGLLVKGDLDELVAAVSRLLDNSEDLRKMGTGARERLARHFTFSTFSKNLRSLL